MGVLGMPRGNFYGLYAGTLIAIRHEQVTRTHPPLDQDSRIELVVKWVDIQSHTNRSSSHRTF